MEIIIGIVAICAAAAYVLWPKSKASVTATESAPYKVETPAPTVAEAAAKAEVVSVVANEKSATKAKAPAKTKASVKPKDPAKKAQGTRKKVA
jgi:hypothetical protein